MDPLGGSLVDSLLFEALSFLALSALRSLFRVLEFSFSFKRLFLFSGVGGRETGFGFGCPTLAALGVFPSLASGLGFRFCW